MYLLERFSRKPEFNYHHILLVVIIFLAISARIIPGPRTIDDSYITYRYARNILSGNGFVYNPGENVLGTTTPLYTLLLVAISIFSGGAESSFPQIAMIVNAIADAITCLLLFDLGTRLGSKWAGLGAALVWAIAPYSVTFSIGGLETSIYVLLLTATVDAHLRKHRTIAAMLASLSILTRPDALILIAPLGIDRALQAWKTRKTQLHHNDTHIQDHISVNELLAFLLPLLGWFIYSMIQFGSPLPHSIIAKQLAYRLPSNAGLIRFIQHYATPFLGHLTFGIPWILVGSILYLFLSIVGIRKSIKTEPHSWPFLIYPWLYFATFSLANPLIFRWYLTPPLPAYILTILIGADALITDLINRFRSSTTGQSEREEESNSLIDAVSILVVILIPLMMSLRGWTLSPDHGLNRPAPKMAWYQLELLYKDAANLLSPKMESKYSPPVLAAGDVGVLGFYTSSRILDTVGLNSRISVNYYPLDRSYYVINYAIPPDLIMDMKPDYIVILEVYGREGILNNQEFHDTYILYKKIPTDIYGSDGMLIFEKKTSS